MAKNLNVMSEAGSITGYQLMMDCLQRLDPEHPEHVLSELPAEVLDEMLAYARRHDPRRPRSATSPPLEDRVRAAERWISSHHAESPNPAGR